MIGIVKITMLNPVAAAMLFHYEELENKYLKGKTSLLAVSETGLWLRQIDGNNELDCACPAGLSRNFELSNVVIFLFKDNDHFAGRIDAETAKLDDGYWQIPQSLDHRTRPAA